MLEGILVSGGDVVSTRVRWEY